MPEYERGKTMTDYKKEYEELWQTNIVLKAEIKEADEALQIHVKREGELITRIKVLEEKLAKAENFVRYVNQICNEEGSYHP